MILGMLWWQTEGKLKEEKEGDQVILMVIYFSKHYHVPYIISVLNETPAHAFHLTRVLL